MSLRALEKSGAMLEGVVELSVGLACWAIAGDKRAIKIPALKDKRSTAHHGFIPKLEHRSRRLADFRCEELSVSGLGCLSRYNGHAHDCPSPRKAAGQTSQPGNRRNCWCRVR